MRNLGVHLFIVANLASLMLAGCMERPEAVPSVPVLSVAEWDALKAKPEIEDFAAPVLAKDYWKAQGFKPEPGDVVLMLPCRSYPFWNVLMLYEDRVTPLSNPSLARMTDALPRSFFLPQARADPKVAFGPQLEGGPRIGFYEVEILNGKHRGKKGLVMPDQIKALVQSTRHR